jgi:undecaprenyl-diphosphatase
MAFLPTALVGFFAYGFIKSFLLESPQLVSAMLILGGVVFIVLNKKIETTLSKVVKLEDISYKNAFLIGCTQCLAMIPGVSRSGATILGGVFNGFDKKMATEFSFLLAIPTMLAATGYDLLKTSLEFTHEEWKILGVGFLVAFLVALLAIKTFLELLKRFPFSWFGWYRIALGIVFLIVFW